jgi:hypothetical protein
MWRMTMKLVTLAQHNGALAGGGIAGDALAASGHVHHDRKSSSGAPGSIDGHDTIPGGGGTAWDYVVL